MKKLLSALLLLTMVFSLFIPTSYAAKGIEKNDLIININQKVEVQDLINYELAVINLKDNPYSTEELVQLIDNGVSVMFYGEGLQLEAIQSLVNDDNDMEMNHDPRIADKISVITVTNINGMYNYGGVIDATDTELTDNKTGEKIKIKDAVKKSGEKFIVHNPLSYVNKMYDDVKEAKKKVYIDNDTSQLNTQMPPSGWHSIQFNWYYDFSNYGEMKAPVYVYKRGISSGTYYWDLISSMTASAKKGYCVVAFKLKLEVNDSSQQIVDWTDLPSKTASFSTGLSGNVPGVSYTSSTQGVSLKQVVRYADKFVEWNANSRPLFLSSGDGQAFKIEPGIRVSDKDNRLKFRRYYYMDIENVFWGTSYKTSYFYSEITLSY